jgi:hypothetical protein
MDPVTLVLTALVSGLTSGLTDSAKETVKNLFLRLSNQLKKKVKTSPEASKALEEVIRKPESEGRQLVLKEELEILEVEKDHELISLARSLMEQLDQAGTQTGKYQIAIKHVENLAIGDGARAVNKQQIRKKKK